MDELQTLIQTTCESQALKRALVVPNTLAGRSWPAVSWIQAQLMWDVRSVPAHVWERDGIRYKSLQSYDALLREAWLSWKQNQHRHPAMPRAAR